jgi:hypothetical protein
MRKFNALRRMKTKACAGKATATDLNKAKSTYVDAAVKKGQTKAEANAKAERIINGKCSMTKVSGPKRKPGRPKAKK